MEFILLTLTRSNAAENRQFPAAMTLHLFRCGSSALYAYAADVNCNVLPKLLCGQMQWRYEGPVALNRDKNAEKWGAIKVLLDAIRRDGFYLMHQAIENELPNYLLVPRWLTAGVHHHPSCESAFHLT